MTKNFYRVDTLVKAPGLNYFSDPGQVLRIAKRKRAGIYFRWQYFCVALDSGVGHGVWLSHGQIRPLTPLELLAMQVD